MARAKKYKDGEIDKMYERYRENLVAGPSTRPSSPGNWRNPMVNELNVIPRKPKPTPPKPKPPTGGGSTKRVPKIGGSGGGLRIGLRRGIGDR